MRIGKIASGAEYQMEEKFQNLLIFGILIVFTLEKIPKIPNFETYYPISHVAIIN